MNSRTKNITKHLRRLLRKREDAQIESRQDLPIMYSMVKQLEKTPADVEVKPDDFISVVYQGKKYWTVFHCPCGCSEVVSLPMTEPHRPRWSLRVSRDGYPTLSPSVWRNQGCMSHFWIRDGKVYWCGNTGTAPWIARPDLYSHPSRKIV